MRWTLWRARRARMKRTVKSCGPDAPTLASSRPRCFRIAPATVATKPVTGESAKETVKTIARGRPGVSGVTVVDLLGVLFIFAPEATGAVRAPGFPCALFSRDEDFDHSSGALCRESAEACTKSPRPLAGRGRVASWRSG